MKGLGALAAQYAVSLNRIFLHSLPVDLAIFYRQKMKKSEVIAREEESYLESSPLQTPDKAKDILNLL